MKLYFTCPFVNETFATANYLLQEGHQITKDDQGKKQLMGFVSLHSPCPFCGQKHRYEVKDVMCPLHFEKNEG